MIRRCLHALAVGLFVSSAAALALTACSGGSEGGSTQVDQCGPGMAPGPNGCIRRGDDDNDDEDATSIPDSTEADAGDVSVDSSGTGDDTSSSECPGGCPSGEFCLDGQCRQGSKCMPGEKLGCIGGATLRVCTDKGVGFREEPCPDDKPNCVSFKKDNCDQNIPECYEPKCTNKICDPGTKFCKDDVTLMKCSSDGTSSDQVELCRGKCKDGQCVSACQGNAKSYIGCGFYAVDMDNYTIKCSSDRICQSIGGFGSSAGECQQGVCTCPNNAPSSCQETNVNGQQFAVTISNTSSRKVSVKILKPDGTEVTSGSVNADALEVFELPGRNPEDSGISKNSYRIQADGPVTVHQFNPKNQADVFSNDASLVLPSNAMGKEYTVIGWSSMPAPDSPDRVHQTGRPYVTIVAVEQGTTTVDVETPAKIISGNGVQSLSPGDTASYELEKGQVVQLMGKQESSNDLTGMSISADQKVAVFSGHECSEVPTGTAACDHLEQQLLPESTWGTNYLLSKFKPRGDEPDKYRLVAAEDGTTIQTNPRIARLDGETLDAGETMNFELRPNLEVTADKPISIGQFMVGSAHSGVTAQCDTRPTSIGDPAFTAVVPSTQYRRDYVVYTPTQYQEDWLTIVAEKSTSVTIDGTDLSSSGKQIGNTSWYVHYKKVSPGVHEVSADSPVGLYSYGYDCDVSYAYPGGLDLTTNTRKP